MVGVMYVQQCWFLCGLKFRICDVLFVGSTGPIQLSLEATVERHCTALIIIQVRMSGMATSVGYDMHVSLCHEWVGWPWLHCIGRRQTNASGSNAQENATVSEACPVCHTCDDTMVSYQ